MPKALIIGGGMAGSVAAIALRRAGIDAEVYEAYDRGADGVGAFLTLAINGMDALRALDLHTLVRDKGFDTPRMSIGLGRGKPLADARLGAPLADGTVNQTITRADLYGALRDEAVRRGVRIEYGKRLVGVAPRDAAEDGVVATFADGGTAHGDLLIGADGMWSVTRRIIDPAAPEPRYVPLLNTGGYASGIALDADPGVMHMTFARRGFFCYLVHPDGTVWWFANLPQPTELPRAELAAITPDRWRALLLDLFAGERIPATRIIEASDTVFSGWSTYDFPTVPTWHRDRMIIIGDAAHATSPAAGQGAALALEDAVVLAKCLRDLPDTGAAFARFEGLRRDRVERVVAQGKRNGDGKTLGRVGRLLLPLVFRLAGDPTAKLAWMYDHRVDWDTPVGATAAGV